MHDKLKLSVSLELPKEPEYKPDIMDKVSDCMERVEYGDDPGAYTYLRKLLAFATKCHHEGKRGDKLHKILGILTPFMLRYGLEDLRGLDIINGYATNPDYQEDGCGGCGDCEECDDE